MSAASVDVRVGGGGHGDPEGLRAVLVGSWMLHSYTERDLATGEIGFPFGECASGMITYTPDGAMSVLICRNDLDSDRADLFEMSPEEAMSVAGGFLAYGGTFACEPGAVVHRVEISSIPSFARVVQRRAVRLEEGVLTLSTDTPVLSRGRTVVATLTWHRRR